MKSNCHHRFLIIAAFFQAVQSRATLQGRQISDHQFLDGINRGEQWLAKAKAMKQDPSGTGGNVTTHVISQTTAVNVTVDGLGGNGTPQVTVHERHLPPIDVSPPAPTPPPPVMGPHVQVVAVQNGPMPRSVAGLLVLYVPSAQVSDFENTPAARQAIKEGIAYASFVVEELVTMTEALPLQHANITQNGQNLSSVDYLFELNTVDGHEDTTVNTISSTQTSQLEEKIHAALNVAGIANADACVVHQFTAQTIPADQRDPDLTIVPTNSAPHETMPAEDNLLRSATGDVSLLRREAFGRL